MENKIYRLNRSIEVLDSKWESDFFSFEENQYYKINLTVQSSIKGMFGVIFYNENLKKLNHDFFSSFSNSDHFSTITSFFSPKNGAKKGRLVFLSTDSLKIKEISIEKTCWKDVLCWLEHLQNNVIKVRPFICKKRFIQRTIDSFKNGKRVKVVLLGDSIINDTSNSFFEVLLRKIYPAIQIEIIPSVRDSTGCPYYEKENRVKQYVIDYEPDLLMIGGISNNEDVDSIRNVIRQVRKSIDPEIFVMNEIFGKEDASWNELSQTPDAGKNSYRYKLEKLSEEEKIEFFDINRYWLEFLRYKEKHYEFFLRDELHPNDYGRLVIAYLLFYFFHM